MSDELQAVRQLDPRECWAHLRTTDLGRLALVVSGAPEIFPVNFVVDHGTVVFRTAPGTKLAAAKVWPAVAFEADGRDEATGEVWSVVVKGSAAELTGMNELLSAEDLPLVPVHAGPKNRFVRIEPGAVTGRRFRAVHEEAWPSPLREATRTAVD